MKFAMGIILALAIGAVCRLFEVPVPAPPKLQGVLLVAAITIGYIAMDMVMEKKTPQGQTTSQDSSINSRK